MKKTIVVEFPDGFEFPEKADVYKKESKCSKCPLMIENDGYWYGCFVTDKSDAPCPFYGGEDNAKLVR